MHAAAQPAAPARHAARSTAGMPGPTPLALHAHATARQSTRCSLAGGQAHSSSACAAGSSCPGSPAAATGTTMLLRSQLGAPHSPNAPRALRTGAGPAGVRAMPLERQSCNPREREPGHSLLHTGGLVRVALGHLGRGEPGRAVLRHARRLCPRLRMGPCSASLPLARQRRLPNRHCSRASTRLAYATLHATNGSVCYTQKESAGRA